MQASANRLAYRQTSRNATAGIFFSLFVLSRRQKNADVRVGVVGIGAAIAVVHHLPLLVAVDQINEVRILFGLPDERRLQQFLGRRPLHKGKSRAKLNASGALK
jgi:hypothetical protein